MKNVSIIGIVGLPACYGGFESLVENLNINRDINNITYTVFCSSNVYKDKIRESDGARLIYLPLKANGIQSVLYDIISLIKCWFINNDTILILGVSGGLFLPIFKIFSNAKIITNIDGLEWKRDKWGKLARWFLKISERFSVNYSDVVVADNKAISDYIFNEYKIKAETIAYGGDHAIRQISTPNIKEKYHLGLCRIEPENNVEMILEAYSKIDIKLKFIGNWTSSEFGLKLKNKYKVFLNIELLDPVYDLDYLFLLRSGCDLYLHGHSAGGTNPSLVEMMHFGKPIFAFDCLFNRFSTRNKAYYFSSADELIKLLNNSVGEVGLKENAFNMISIAKEEYTWSKIVHRYESLYK